jgi:hypothetical protein
MEGSYPGELRVIVVTTGVSRAHAQGSLDKRYDAVKQKGS